MYFRICSYFYSTEQFFPMFWSSFMVYEVLIYHTSCLRGMKIHSVMQLTHSSLSSEEYPWNCISQCLSEKVVVLKSCLLTPFILELVYSNPSLKLNCYPDQWGWWWIEDHLCFKVTQIFHHQIWMVYIKSFNVFSLLKKFSPTLFISLATESLFKKKINHPPKPTFPSDWYKIRYLKLYCLQITH